MPWIIVGKHLPRVVYAHTCNEPHSHSLTHSDNVTHSYITSHSLIPTLSLLESHFHIFTLIVVAGPINQLTTHPQIIIT